MFLVDSNTTLESLAKQKDALLQANPKDTLKILIEYQKHIKTIIDKSSNNLHIEDEFDVVANSIHTYSDAIRLAKLNDRGQILVAKITESAVAKVEETDIPINRIEITRNGFDLEIKI